MKYILLLLLICAAIIVFILVRRRKESQPPIDHYVCSECGSRHCICRKETPPGSDKR